MKKNFSYSQIIGSNEPAPDYSVFSRVNTVSCEENAITLGNAIHWLRTSEPNGVFSMKVKLPVAEEIVITNGERGEETHRIEVIELYRSPMVGAFGKINFRGQGCDVRFGWF